MGFPNAKSLEKKNPAREHEGNTGTKKGSGKKEKRNLEIEEGK